MSAPAPSRREIALDLFRDHHDLTRLSRAMALSRAEREGAARKAAASDAAGGDPRRASPQRPPGPSRAPVPKG